MQMELGQRFYLWGRKAVACGLALSMCFQGPSAQAFVPDVSGGVSDREISLLDVSIPKQIGSIKEKFDGQGGKTFFIIQDAHAIPQAQRSIQKLIEFSEKEYGVRVVAIEGAESDFDAGLFKSFPDKERLQEVFEDYFERGELTGSAAAAVFSPFQAVYHGMEDWQLYQEGLGYFLEAARAEASVLDRIETLFQQLQNEKERIYSKQLLAVDGALRSFHQNASDLMLVLEQLAAISPPSKDSELALLIAELGHSKENDMALEAEVRRIAGQVRSALTQKESSPPVKADLMEFHQKIQDFQTAQLAPEALALFLKELSIKHHIRVRVTKRLNARVGKQKRMKDIEGTKLYDEFEEYARGVKQTLFRGDEERALDLRSHLLELAEKLAKLELSRGDWNEIKPVLIKMDAWTISQDGVDGSGEIAGLFGTMQPNLKFYENAEKRDRVFMEQTEALLKKHRANAAALVAGGFHADGITALLRAKGFSYVLIMPEIKSIPDETNYRAHMEGKVTWGDYFEVQNGKVNLYDAFVRGTRDQLLKRNKPKDASAARGQNSLPTEMGDPRLLKNWRDQIIRDLADQNKITQAGEYTRFIDELADPEARQTNNQNGMAAQWRANVEGFVSGLRQLRDKNQLSEQTIAGLWQKAMISDAPTYAGLSRSEIRADLLPGLGSASRWAAAGEKKGFVRSEVRAQIESAAQVLRELSVSSISAGTLTQAATETLVGNISKLSSSHDADVIKRLARQYISDKSDSNLVRLLVTLNLAVDYGDFVLSQVRVRGDNADVVDVLKSTIINGVTHQRFEDVKQIPQVFDMAAKALGAIGTRKAKQALFELAEWQSQSQGVRLVNRALGYDIIDQALSHYFGTSLLSVLHAQIKTVQGVPNTPALSFQSLSFLEPEEQTELNFLIRELRDYQRRPTATGLDYLKRAAGRLDFILHQYGLHVWFLEDEEFGRAVISPLIGLITKKTPHESSKADGSEFEVRHIENQGKALTVFGSKMRTEGYQTGYKEPIVIRDKEYISEQRQYLTQKLEAWIRNGEEAVDHVNALKLIGYAPYLQSDGVFAETHYEDVEIHEVRHFFNRELNLIRYPDSVLSSDAINHMIIPIGWSRNWKGADNIDFERAVAEEVSAFLAELALSPVATAVIGDLFGRVKTVMTQLAVYDVRTLKDLRGRSADAGVKKVLLELLPHDLAAIEILDKLVSTLAQKDARFSSGSIYEMTSSELDSAAGRVKEMFLSGQFTEDELSEFAESVFQERFQASLFVGKYKAGRSKQSKSVRHLFYATLLESALLKIERSRQVGVKLTIQESKKQLMDMGLSFQTSRNINAISKGDFLRFDGVEFLVSEIREGKVFAFIVPGAESIEFAKNYYRSFEIQELSNYAAQGNVEIGFVGMAHAEPMKRSEVRDGRVSRRVFLGAAAGTVVAIIAGSVITLEMLKDTREQNISLARSRRADRPQPSLKTPWESFKSNEDEPFDADNIRHDLLVTLDWLIASDYAHKDAIDQYAGALERQISIDEGMSAPMRKEYDPRTKAFKIVINPREMHRMMVAVKEAGSMDVFTGALAWMVVREAWGLEMTHRGYVNRGDEAAKSIREVDEERKDKRLDARDLNLNNRTFTDVLESRAEKISRSLNLYFSMEVYEALREWEFLDWAQKQGRYDAQKINQAFKQLKPFYQRSLLLNYQTAQVSLQSRGLGSVIVNNQLRGLTRDKMKNMAAVMARPDEVSGKIIVYNLFLAAKKGLIKAQVLDSSKQGRQPSSEEYQRLAMRTWQDLQSVLAEMESTLPEQDRLLPKLQKTESASAQAQPRQEQPSKVEEAPQKTEAPARPGTPEEKLEPWSKKHQESLKDKKWPEDFEEKWVHDPEDEKKFQEWMENGMKGEAPLVRQTKEWVLRSEMRQEEFKDALQRAGNTALAVQVRLQALNALGSYFTDRQYADSFAWYDLFHWADAKELNVVLAELQQAGQDPSIQEAARVLRANIIEKMGPPNFSAADIDTMKDEEVFREIHHVSAWHKLWAMPMSPDQIRPYAEGLRRYVSVSFAKNPKGAYGWLSSWEKMNFENTLALEDFLVGFSLADALHRESSLRLLQVYLLQADSQRDDRIINLFDEKLRDIHALQTPPVFSEEEAAERDQQWQDMPVQEQTAQAGFFRFFDNLIGTGPYNLFDFVSEKFSERRLDLAMELVRDFERESEEKQTHEHTAFEDKPFPHVYWDNVRGEKAYAALGRFAALDFLNQLTQVWGTPEQSRVGEDLSLVLEGQGEKARIERNRSYGGLFFNPQRIIHFYKQAAAAAKTERAKEIAEYALEKASARSETRRQDSLAPDAEVRAAVESLLEVLRPGEERVLDQREIGQIYNLSRQDLEGLIQIILKTLDEKLMELNARTQGDQTQSDGALALRGAIQLAGKLLSAGSSEVFPENITFAVHFSPTAEPEAFLNEILKRLEAAGVRAEVLSDGHTHESFSKKMTQAVRGFLRLKKLAPRDLREGTVVSEEGLGVVTALDDPKTAEFLNQTFQGLLFEKKGMAEDPDSQLAGQILFAAILIKLAVISAQSRNEETSNPSEFLKAALIRALGEAGFVLDGKQVITSNSGGLISIMGSAFIRALVQDMRARQETAQAA